MVRTVAVLIFLFWSSLVNAETRVALVIGNGAYTNVVQLSNPPRDAEAVASLLRSAGFDLVVAERDLGGTAMRRSLRDFSDRVREADIAVIFYAGHGIEVNGANYLIPIDAVLERDIDVEDETVPIERLIQILEPAKRLRLVILDACRDNPFTRSMKRTIAGRSIGRGLAKIDVLTSDTLIAFSAKAGSTALDGNGTNSPYTTALLKHLVTPGLDLRLALGRVRDEVLASTASKQEPFLYGSLGGSEVALVSSQVPQQIASPMPPKPPVDYEKEMEITFWNSVKDAKSRDLLRAYLDHYPAGTFAGLAKVLIEQLDKEHNAARLAAERDAHAQLAEAARVAAEAKQTEELRKADVLGRARVMPTIEPLSDSIAIVRSFYAALGAADGVRASSLVVPEKRATGPFNAAEITKFYGSLAEPLRLTDLIPLGDNKVRVDYTYRTNTHTCTGQGIVTIARRDARTLIEGIQVLNQRC